MIKMQNYANKAIPPYNYKSMKLSLAFSPCPNDTFIFDAMIHQKIDTEGLRFEVIMEDVEALNRRAAAGKVDITKLSYHAYAYLNDQYVLLDAGSALGNNCGPMLIAKKSLDESEINQGPIAIPGRMTTANFLFSLAYPEAVLKKEMVFSEIQDAILDNKVAGGVIIHENRFTYQSKGLIKIIDLGEYWETLTGLPIPLGGIVVNRNLPEAIQHSVNRVMQRSVRFAMDHPDESKPFVVANAQEMEESVMYQHIHLYVNNYTENLGEKGKQAVNTLFNMAIEKGLISQFKSNIFLN